jgi:hypothetical protein
MQRNLTIDPTELPDLPETIEFKQPGAEEAKYFLSTSVGDEVTIEGNYGSTRRFKVESVTSAYRRLLDLAHKAITESIKPVPNALPITIPDSPEGVDFSQLHAQLKRVSAHAKQALERYETTAITLGGLCRMMGKSPVDVIRGWEMNGPSLFVCTGTVVERNAAIALLADLSSAFVIDSATMTELVLLDCVDALAVVPKLFVSSTTRDIVQVKLQEARLQRSSMQAFDDDGRLAIIEMNAQDHARNIWQLEAVVAAIEKYCEVVPAYGPEVQNGLLARLQKATSNEEHSVLLLAAERGAHLLTVDGRLRYWAAAALVQGVWPQALLMFAVSKEAISGFTYSLATARMLLGNRSFVSLRAEDLLIMCRQGDAWLKYGIARYKRYLSDSGTEFESAIDITLEFLLYVAKSFVHVGAFAELLKHTVEGILRRKDCPPDVMDRIATFLTNLLSPNEPAYLYGPVMARHAELVLAANQTFRQVLKEAETWAQQPPQDRAIKVKVLMCGRTPLLSYSGDETVTTTAARQGNASAAAELNSNGGTSTLLRPEPLPNAAQLADDQS